MSAIERRREPEHPWLRLPGESVKAYTAFCHYRDGSPLPDGSLRPGLPAMNRSYMKTADGLGRNVSWIREWAKKYRWVDRVEEYDLYLERSRRVAQEEAIRDMDERHARLAVMLLHKVAQRVVGDDVASVQALDLNKLTAADTTRLAEVAYKMERLARGADREREGVGDDQGVKLTVRFDTQPVYPAAEEADETVELPPESYRELGPGEGIAPSG